MTVTRPTVNLPIGLMVLSLMTFQCGAAVAEPRYKLDPKQEKAIELSNLSPSPDCHPGTLTGRVAKRNFDDQGVRMISVVVEDRSGERSLINIDTDEIGNASRLVQGWVAQGLQTLLREGRTVTLKVRWCGAAGRVAMLDGVRGR